MAIFNPFLPSGGGGSGGAVTSKDVDFIDYDGTLVASYTADEFAELTEMPANPTHEGLTAQGWNWTLADAQEYVASYGKLIIGQTYTTTSGATEIDIELQEGRIAPYCSFAVNGTVTIDWGDGSTNTVTGTSTSTVINTQHTYASAGKYTIKLIPNNGTTYALLGNSSSGSYLLWKNSNGTPNRVYQTTIKSVRLGVGCLVKDYAFGACCSLASVTIPSKVTGIGNYAFYGCSSLVSATIPSGATNIGQYMFYMCYSLMSVSMPISVTAIYSYAFHYCTSLASITISSDITNIGDSAFYYCYSLASMLMPNRVTIVGSYAFGSCLALKSVTISSGVTSISNNMFYGCNALASVTIPSNATYINTYAFYSCCSLASVTIPSKVTGIGNYAFYNCSGLCEIHFKSTTPPTVTNSNAWTGLPTDCKIYVPAGKLSAYTSATNYPSSSTYTYIEE